MITLDNKSLAQVKGGVSSAIITAVVRVFTTIIDFGTKIGSSIRRATTGNICS